MSLVKPFSVSNKGTYMYVHTYKWFLAYQESRIMFRMSSDSVTTLVWFLHGILSRKLCKHSTLLLKQGLDLLFLWE